MRERDVIDAKYRVVRPKRGWRLYFDWRNFLIVSAIIIAGGAQALLETMQ